MRIALPYSPCSPAWRSPAASSAHAQARRGPPAGRQRGARGTADSRDQAIPDRLLERAYGIAVIPDLTKVAFFAGGRRGQGVLVVRDKQGSFTDPVFVTMTGGSFGWQWGVQSADIVLVFTTAEGRRGHQRRQGHPGGRCLGGGRPGWPPGLGGHRRELQGGGLLLLAQPRRVRRYRPRWHGHQHRRRCQRRLLQEAGWPPRTSLQAPSPATTTAAGASWRQWPPAPAAQRSASAAATSSASRAGAPTAERAAGARRPAAGGSPFRWRTRSPGRAEDRSSPQAALSPGASGAPPPRGQCRNRAAGGPSLRRNSRRSSASS